MKNKGFTLIELMVSIAIMMVMTLVVFFNYNRFNESSLLNSIAYDLSLTIRQAQIYGMSGRETITKSSQAVAVENVELSSAYGVHFQKSNEAEPVVLFIDANSNNQFDGGESSVEKIQSYSFQKGIKIKDICKIALSGNCTNGTNESYEYLDIIFKRPDPEATILNNGTDVGNVRIILQNSDDDPSTQLTKSVVIYSTGQISVK